MTAPNRVLLLTLSERTSAKGRRYMSGWLGKASVVAFPSEEPDKYGNPQWEVFVTTPEPRAEPQPGRESGNGHARQAAYPVERRPPRERPSPYVRGRPRPEASGADGEPFYDDPLDDLGRAG